MFSLADFLQLQEIPMLQNRAVLLYNAKGITTIFVSEVD